MRFVHNCQLPKWKKKQKRYKGGFSKNINK
jgi:hypothetical protein